MKIKVDINNGKIYRLRKDGEIVECGSDCRGYLQFGLNGKKVYNHRHIMSQYIGRELLPKEHINHINHNTKDNRIENLEIVTHAENMQWKRKPSTNTSGYKHISWNKQKKKWCVCIQEDKKRLFRKLFSNLDEAIQYRNEKIKELNSQGKKYYLPPPESEPALPETDAAEFKENFLGNTKMAITWVGVSEKSAGQYNREAAALEKLFGKTFVEIATMPLDELKKVIESQGMKPATNYCKFKVISKFNTQNSHPRRELIDYMRQLQESDCFKSEKTIDDINLKDKWEQIEAVYDKVLLMFHVMYPPLRSDFYNVKICNYNKETDNYYSDYIIYFNTLVKNNKKFQIEIKDEHKQLIDDFLKDNESDWFYGVQLTNNAYIKRLRRASERNFGVSHAISDFRKIYATSALNNTNSAKEFTETQALIAEQMNHSTQVQSKHYILDNERVPPVPPPRTIKPEPTLDNIEFVINGKKVRVSGTNIKVEIISE